jgi:hypothetical protein
VPSLLYALGNSSDLQEVGSQGAEVKGLAADDNSDELQRFVEDNGVTYVYLGYRGGGLRESTFAGDPHFRLVYGNDGVYIFELNRKKN